MKRKSKLKCFKCNNKFGLLPIYRYDTQPYCDECMRETLDCIHFGSDGFIEWIMNELKTDIYQGNYSKLENNFMIVRCPQCQSYLYFLTTDTNSNGTKYNDVGSESSCSECSCYFAFDKHGKIEQFAENEDKYIEKYNTYKQPPLPPSIINTKSE